MMTSDVDRSFDCTTRGDYSAKPKNHPNLQIYVVQDLAEKRSVDLVQVNVNIHAI